MPHTFKMMVVNPRKPEAGTLGRSQRPHFSSIRPSNRIEVLSGANERTSVFYGFEPNVSPAGPERASAKASLPDPVSWASMGEGRVDRPGRPALLSVTGAALPRQIAGLVQRGPAGPVIVLIQHPGPFQFHLSLRHSIIGLSIVAGCLSLVGCSLDLTTRP